MNARTLSLHLLVLGLSLCGTLFAHAQPPEPKCDAAALDRSAADMRTARDAAQKISEDERDTEVPPEAIKQIQQFKNSLYAALESYFLCHPNLNADSKDLQSDLYTRLAIPVPPPAKQATYNENDRGPWTGQYLGDITFQVKVVRDARKLIAVLTTFGIPYGEDAQLDVFAPNDHGIWQPVINLTSKPYNSIAGAFQSFDYKISPPDAKGDWFAVATHVNPWPQSCLQSIFVDAVRPNHLGMQYQLFQDEQGAYICDDAAPYLRSVTATGFQVRFSTISIDESQLYSTSVMLYKVEGDEVTRVQPVALNPVNFADEWTRRPWRDAQGWSDPANLAKLRDAHSSLHTQGANLGDFVGLRVCPTPAPRSTAHRPASPPTPTAFEVELKPAEGDAPDTFFLIKKNPDGYTMLKVTDRATPSCRGPNRITAIKDR